MSQSRRASIRSLFPAPSTSEPVSSTNQNFQPKYEWKDEKEKGALTIIKYSPGFLKELKRDASTRPVVDYKFIHFDIVSNTNKIITQFALGTLTITIPKNKIASQPVGVGPPKEEATTRSQEEQAPLAIAASPPDQRITSSSSGLISQPKKSEPPPGTTAKDAVADDHQQAKAM